MNPDPHTSKSDFVQHLVSHAAHRLPAQGPIGVFIHHNTLHSFQHLPFEQAVVDAAAVYGTQPYLSEEHYRRFVGEGRIQMDDIDATLKQEEAGQPKEIWPGLTRRELRRRLLVPGLRRFQPETIQWDLEQAGVLDSDEDRALFEICLRHTPAEDIDDAPPVRARDGVLAHTGTDIDDVIHPWLIRLGAVYLDQGMSYWSMPNRDQGFLAAALTLLDQPFCLLPEQLKTLPKRVRELAPEGVPPEEIVIRILELLGLEESEWEHAIQAELLALGGWAGMMHRLEVEPELAPHQMLPAKLMDFLALRLLLTIATLDSQLPNTRAWKQLPSSGATSQGVPSTFERRLAKAAILFDAAAQLGISSLALSGKNSGKNKFGELDGKIGALQPELARFGDVERRRVLHLAYERRHERKILLPLQQHRRRPSAAASDKLSAQIFFCLDEREESFRRNLEEIAPDIETFGVAGFYGVAVNYTGLDDAHGVSLCPVVVKPRHAVKERPAQGHDEAHARRIQLRRLWARTTRGWFVSSRTFFRGWLGTTVLGVFSIVPMAARIFGPRQYANVISWLNASILPEPRTELAFERSGVEGHAAAEGLLQGFTVEEKVERVAAILKMAGLTKGMARLVLTLGHGSTSLNNPMESAYDCGACGGRRGGPNGRLFAAMANHPQVRLGLRERGVFIPDDTWFIGGYHDTGNDDVELFDLEDVPQTHRRALAQVREAIDKTRAANAHERTRRFEAASSSASPKQALQHVQGRAEHLAEPRPECGHCTNAVTILARRASTKGLFMDRRAFLISYDAAQDPIDSSLAGLLGAAVPVCAGISLEYYFSYVDNERYGCGSKLPHNVTSLLGVMNGYESDLRTGLPWQMVEIHEPVRNLFIIESTPERIVKTIQSNALNWEFLDKRWIRLAAMDPETGAMQVYRDGVWEKIDGDDELLGSAPTSVDWYSKDWAHNHRKHLNLARIEARTDRARAPVAR